MKIARAPFILFIFILSCVHNPINEELSRDVSLFPLESTKYVKKDLSFNVNGSNFNGTGVVIIGSDDVVNINTNNLEHPFTHSRVFTCHRRIITEGKQRKFIFSFKPASGIENEGLCFAEIGLFNENKIQYYLGSFVIINANELPHSMLAEVFCDGRLQVSANTTYCQAFNGLEQKIKFQKDVILKSYEDRCTPSITGSKKEYTFRPPIGMCLFKFFSEDGKFHRLITYGYEYEILREVK